MEVGWGFERSAIDNEIGLARSGRYKRHGLSLAISRGRLTVADSATGGGS
jgi:hypothetical protein